MERSRERVVVGRHHSCYFSPMKQRTFSPKKATLETVVSTLETVVSSVADLSGAVGVLGTKFTDLSTRVEGLGSEVKGLSHSVKGLEQRVDGLDKKFDGLDKRMGGLEQKVDGMDKRMGGLEQKVDGMDQKFEKRFDEVQEVVCFLKDNVLMKDETATKTELVDFKSEVITHVDQFVKLHMKQEAEIAAVAHSLVRHEQAFHTRPANA